MSGTFTNKTNVRKVPHYRPPGGTDRRVGNDARDPMADAQAKAQAAPASRPPEPTPAADPAPLRIQNTKEEHTRQAMEALERARTAPDEVMALREAIAQFLMAEDAGKYAPVKVRLDQLTEFQIRSTIKNLRDTADRLDIFDSAEAGMVRSEAWDLNAILTEHHGLSPE